MANYDHPLKGEFDAPQTMWKRPFREDGQPSALEIGYVSNGMVALRLAGEPKRAPLIYTSEEWEAFTLAAKDGEFDLDTWGAGS